MLLGCYNDNANDVTDVIYFFGGFVELDWSRVKLWFC